MKKIDCLGEVCPVPIIHLQNHIKKIEKGETIIIITDHSCTLVSIKDFCKNHKFKYKYEEVINGVWEVKVFKTI